MILAGIDISIIHQVFILDFKASIGRRVFILPLATSTQARLKLHPALDFRVGLVQSYI